MKQKNETESLPLCWYVIGAGYFILGIFGILNHPENLYWKMTFVFGIVWVAIIAKHLKEGKIPRKITRSDVFVFGIILIVAFCGLVFVVTSSSIITAAVGISVALIIYILYKN